ncbi:MAG: phosphoribosylanthranilate isomerase [Ignavibacteriae bacterium]|nr:phosphoribosylanthranilate isomerase [Ignavibacteria bacterium]MBI3365357.1 phosphoribosylanthranilate isomerase [Ignavibacteriota bacterium]
MQPTQKPRIKICCIGSIEEANMAIRYGASALGLVSAMPSGPGPIPEERIVEIAEKIPPGVASFLLTCKQEAESIINQQRSCRTSTLQLVDAVSIDTYKRLRDALPGISIVQVIHVLGEEAMDEATSVASYVNAILLDSGNPRMAVKELGGTGRKHDWSISRRIREAVNVPIFLAGGLKPENVREAIERVSPFGLDVCSGVRTDGKLDETKLAEFFRQVEMSGL